MFPRIVIDASSPCARGWTEEGQGSAVLAALFPVCAGVDRGFGGPGLRNANSSPCARGWTGSERLRNEAAHLFPVCAGVDRTTPNGSSHFPFSSPCARGCTADLKRKHLPWTEDGFLQPANRPGEIHQN